MYKDMKNESMQKVVKSKFTALCHLILIMLYSHVKMSPQEELGMESDFPCVMCLFLCLGLYCGGELSS